MSSNLHPEIARVLKARKDSQAQFFTSSTGREATDRDREIAALVNEKVVDLGTVIFQHLPAGRDRSLGITALEDAQMRLIRSIFSAKAVDA